jgi:hypothetical protein
MVKKVTVNVVIITLTVTVNHLKKKVVIILSEFNKVTLLTNMKPKY